MKAFGVRPKRDLGQNFLIDSNLLDVIARAADLQPEDVVLEVGGGLGVLSEYLAERVRHVHVVELDRSLEPALRDALDPHPNATLHFADAVKLDLAALAPAPTKVVANLPYGVAATVILRTVAELPAGHDLGRHGPEGGGGALRRAGGDGRLRRPVRARPAGLRRPGAAAGVPYRLPPRAERRLRPRRAHPPRPGARRRRCARWCSTASRTAARRCARSLALAPGAEPGIRDRARAALEAIGRPADARAEQLSPGRVARPAGGARAVTTYRCLAPAKINVCLFVGRPRRDGYHPLVSLVQPLSLADELVLEPSDDGGDRVVCAGIEGENLAARALHAFRAATRWDGPPVRLTITKRVPVAGGMGGGSADAAATLRLAAAASGHDDPGLLHELAIALGADVPSLLAPGSAA